MPPSYSDSEAEARRLMVQQQIAARGVADERVLAAMAAVPRHCFLAPEQLPLAYLDEPVPIGFGQTISQPYIVAAMAECLALDPDARVLEVGAGCGYLAAVLSHLAQAVFAVELEPALCARARATLDRLGYGRVHLRCGDGAQGWPEQAPFDAILFSCAAAELPPEPWRQLKPGGRLLLPLGEPGSVQQLVLADKGSNQVTRLMPVLFVPLRQGC